MSLDISVTNKRAGENRDMNWLRNPFGLERWARANYLYIKKEEPTPDLWDVCNKWANDKASEVDKPLFQAVVKEYGEVILSLERGYFWFDVSAFISFILPHKDMLPWHNPLENLGIDHLSIKDAVFHSQQIGIPMEYFDNPCFHLSDRYRPNAHTLAHYQDWYRELIEFAEMLQDPDAEFYCSN